ncbi:hypothetical protein ACFYMX_34115 [Streptomyces griseofuscus]|uniref:hypothetical protein n=1 Tax=Streptomyces griseofuscus TaxID=146922 RepID=UPI00341E36E4
MTSRRPRDLEAERAALRAAADRLLAGTPLRSASKKLTASELLRESGLRRDVAYGDHKDLVEGFQARAKAQHCTPAAMHELAEQNAQLANATQLLAQERRTSASLRRITAELDLELHLAHNDLERSGNVTRLPAPRRSQPASPH